MTNLNESYIDLLKSIMESAKIEEVMGYNESETNAYKLGITYTIDILKELIEQYNN